VCRNAERLANQTGGAGGLGAILEPLPGHLGDPPQILESEGQFAEQVRLVVLVDADVIDVLDAYAAYIEHLLDRLCREAGKVLDAVEPLLGNGGDKLAVP